MTRPLKPRPRIPFEFVLELLAPALPYTKQMFGCTAVYTGEKIVLILRRKDDGDPDNGVWLATTGDHHKSLKNEFASMRSIQLFGPGRTGWQVLPEDGDEFESSVERACRLVLAQDPRIGKIPKRKPQKKLSQMKPKRTKKPANRRRLSAR